MIKLWTQGLIDHCRKDKIAISSIIEFNIFEFRKIIHQIKGKEQIKCTIAALKILSLNI